METTVITNISEYEENIFMGMTLRQAVLGVAGVVLIIIAYLYMSKDMNVQGASYVAIGFGLPCFLFAFARPKKMRLEQFLFVWIESKFLAHEKRYFIADNTLYEAIFKNVPTEKTKERNKTNGDMETEKE